MVEPQLLASHHGGVFITFEGPEGSGKSTQIRFLAQELTDCGVSVLLTREPGGTQFGDQIRSILLDIDQKQVAPVSEVFLMLAQRREHLDQKIVPALAAGKCVLCDRYFDSTVAYQGYGRGLSPASIRSLHETYLGAFLPDQTIILDIDPECGLDRARKGGRASLDRMESETLEFHRRVRQGYLESARLDPDRLFVVPAQDSPEVVRRIIRDHLRNRFPGKFA